LKLLREHPVFFREKWDYCYSEASKGRKKGMLQIVRAQRITLFSPGKKAL